MIKVVSNFVVVSLQVEGAHFWKDAFDKVSYLKDRHRHIFHIKAIKKVLHNDRDVEIIEFKRSIKDFLEKRFRDSFTEMLEFENMSCESIAQLILEQFDCEEVTVLEDNENGALCRIERE